MTHAHFDTHVIRDSEVLDFAFRGSLHLNLKIRNDSAVHGSRHSTLKIRTDSTIRGSLIPNFRIFTLRRRCYIFKCLGIQNFINYSKNLTLRPLATKGRNNFMNFEKEPWYWYGKFQQFNSFMMTRLLKNTRTESKEIDLSTDPNLLKSLIDFYQCWNFFDTLE